MVNWALHFKTSRVDCPYFFPPFFHSLPRVRGAIWPFDSTLLLHTFPYCRVVVVLFFALLNSLSDAKSCPGYGCCKRIPTSLRTKGGCNYRNGGRGITDGVSSVEALHNFEYLRLVPPFSKVAQACRQIMAENDEKGKNLRKCIA